MGSAHSLCLRARVSVDRGERELGREKERGRSSSKLHWRTPTPSASLITEDV